MIYWNSRDELVLPGLVLHDRCPAPLVRFVSFPKYLPPPPLPQSCAVPLLSIDWLISRNPFLRWLQLCVGFIIVALIPPIKLTARPSVYHSVAICLPLIRWFAPLLVYVYSWYTNTLVHVPVNLISVCVCVLPVCAYLLICLIIMPSLVCTL